MLPSLYPHMALTPKLDTEEERDNLKLVQEVWFGMKRLLLKDKKEERALEEGS